MTITSSLNLLYAVEHVFCVLRAIVVCVVVAVVAGFVLPFLSTLLFHEYVLASISQATREAIAYAYHENFVQNDLPMTKYGAVSFLVGLHLSKQFWFLFVSGLLGISVALWRFNVGWTRLRQPATT